MLQGLNKLLMCQLILCGHHRSIVTQTLYLGGLLQDLNGEARAASAARAGRLHGMTVKTLVAFASFHTL